MVQLFGQVAHRALEHAEINHHVLHRAVGLQVGDLEVHHRSPPVAVQVLALAVVIGQEVGRVEAGLGFQSVHDGSFAWPLCSPS